MNALEPPKVKNEKMNKILNELYGLMGIDRKAYEAENTQLVKDGNIKDVNSLNFLRAIEIVSTSIDHKRELSGITEWHGILPQLRSIIIGYACIDYPKCFLLFQQIYEDNYKLDDISYHLDFMFSFKDLRDKIEGWDL